MIKSFSIDVENNGFKEETPRLVYLRLPFLNLKCNDFLLWFFSMGQRSDKIVSFLHLELGHLTWKK